MDDYEKIEIGVKVTCTRCDGKGYQPMWSGASDMDNYPSYGNTERCSSCDGVGFRVEVLYHVKDTYTGSIKKVVRHYEHDHYLFEGKYANATDKYTENVGTMKSGPKYKIRGGDWIL